MRLFLDIGVGRLQTEAWKMKDKFDLIVGVEPHINRFNNLKSKYPGKLLNLAISDKNGEITCWEGEGGLGLFVQNKKAYKKVKKKATTIDTLYEKYGQNADEVWLWADIEGSELLMLKGAKKLLASDRVKWINLEVRKNPPTKGFCSAKQVYDLLKDYKPSIPYKDLPDRGSRDVVFTK